jgi:hypothetical protein
MVMSGNSAQGHRSGEWSTVRPTVRYTTTTIAATEYLKGTSELQCTSTAGKSTIPDQAGRAQAARRSRDAMIAKSGSKRPSAREETVYSFVVEPDD